MKSMDKAIKKLPLLLVLLYLQLKAGHLELIILPRDTEVLANSSTYFNCSTSIRSEQIHWYHYRVGENRTYYVYYKGQFNNMYSERYSIQINTETGEYKLVISSVQPVDAGRYECQDDGGLGGQSSAQLIVLDSTPICLSSMRPEGLVGPNSCRLPVDKLHLSCSVSYIGNKPPDLQWKVEGNDTPISKAIVSDYPGKSITTNLTLSSGVELDGVVFTCGSTRSHNKEHHCKTNPVIINYAVDEPSIQNITKGETITCSANANVPCQYRWFYGNDALCPVSCNQVLTTTRLEEHSCEASCTINGTSCIFVTMRIVVFENETSSTSASEDTTTTLLLAALIPTAVVILVTICVVFIIIARLRKATVENQTLKVKNENLHKTLMLSRVHVHGETETTDEVNEESSERNVDTAEDNQIEKEHLLAGRLQKETDGANIVQTRLNDGEIITKASKVMGRAIAGVAVLEDLIYVVSDRSSEVETFATETRESKTLYKLKELEDPWDLASCRLNNCLYIMDRSYGSKPKYVTRVDSAVKTLARWSTGQEYGSLSVTRDGRVVVTLCDSRLLSIYGSDGTSMNVVPLSKDVIHPLHAIELSHGQFLISYGFDEDNVHRVCVLNENIEIVKNTFEGLEVPRYTAVDPTGLILVADQGNSRVCKFNTELELIEEVASKKHGLRSPQRICLDVRSSRLYVVDNEVLEFKRRNGKLLIFDYILKCS